MPIRSATFICSSPDYRRCPSENLPEVAFIGRSNVGKSSLINMLAGNRQLAKVSGTPGKTRLINHFLIDETWFLVDLPGYGFAKISKTERAKLEQMIAGYIRNRTLLRQVFVLVDCRLKPQTIDIEFMLWLDQVKKPFTVVFTKADKLTKNQLQGALRAYRTALESRLPFTPEILPTSAETKAGKDALTERIEEITR